MTARRSLISGFLTIGLVASAVWWSRAQVPQAKTAVNAEQIVHRNPATHRPGDPKTADAENSGLVQLMIIDADSKQPVYCRVNVIGSDHHFYEPADNPLKPWSLQRLGNRRDKGPIRYYGWFFYCNGKCRVRVPPGKTRVEIWKGFEYSPQTVVMKVPKGKTVAKTVAIQRTVDMASRGWHSGDTHIHLNRRNRTEDDRALELAAAEDIRFAHILAMNNPRTYSPTMGSQIWHQRFGLGEKSVRIRKTGGGRYGIMSGQEYRCGTFGHICLLGHSRLVQADGLKTNPNNWPVFGLVSNETRSLGGYAFHAHGGYEKEIYADFAQRATTGVELLQFAVYRGIALEGWYHILNAGFRFPAVGASDYPYCRALGDCRTYAFLGKREPTFANWDKAAAEGRSFFTTGPLLELTANGKLPGDTMRLPKGKHRLRLKLTARSPVIGMDELHIIANGQIIARRKLKTNEKRGPVTWTLSVPVAESTWIACRAFAKRKPIHREDAEAHTNPIYVRLNDKPPYNAASVRWLIRKLDGRIADHAKRNFPQQAKVLVYFRKSRAALRALLKSR